MLRIIFIESSLTIMIIIFMIIVFILFIFMIKGILRIIGRILSLAFFILFIFLNLIKILFKNI